MARTSEDGPNGSIPSHTETALFAPALLRPKQAADYLALSARTLWTLGNRGDIPQVRLGPGGRIVRYNRAALDVYIQENEVPMIGA